MNTLKTGQSLLIAAILLWLIGCATDKHPTVQFPDQRLPRTTLTYANSAGETTYIVAKDRRNVQAYNQDGSLRWKTNPFNDAKLGPYRFPHPQIFYIGKPQPWQLEGHDRDSIAILFNSSQFGIINPRTGEFTFQGQD
ncbi:MAG: hypothetical protein ACSHX7_14395 [Luteolibacter sp.]